jgi:hypothetical protein
MAGNESLQSILERELGTSLDEIAAGKSGAIVSFFRQWEAVYHDHRRDLLAARDSLDARGQHDFITWFQNRLVAQRSGIQGSPQGAPSGACQPRALGGGGPPGVYVDLGGRRRLARTILAFLPDFSGSNELFLAHWNCLAPERRGPRGFLVDIEDKSVSMNTIAARMEGAGGFTSPATSAAHPANFSTARSGHDAQADQALVHAFTTAKHLLRSLRLPLLFVLGDNWLFPGVWAISILAAASFSNWRTVALTAPTILAVAYLLVSISPVLGWLRLRSSRVYLFFRYGIQSVGGPSFALAAVLAILREVSGRQAISRFLHSFSWLACAMRRLDAQLDKAAFKGGIDSEGSLRSTGMVDEVFAESVRAGDVCDLHLPAVDRPERMDDADGHGQEVPRDLQLRAVDGPERNSGSTRCGNVEIHWHNSVEDVLRFLLAVDIGRVVRFNIGAAVAALAAGCLVPPAQIGPISSSVAAGSSGSFAVPVLATEGRVYVLLTPGLCPGRMEVEARGCLLWSDRDKQSTTRLPNIAVDPSRAASFTFSNLSDAPGSEALLTVRSHDLRGKIGDARSLLITYQPAAPPAGAHPGGQ